MNDIVIIFITFVIICFLILIMFLFLKKTIININQQSKDFFVDKLHAFDDLIEQREETLKGLNEKIDEKQKELLECNINNKNGDSVYLYDQKNIDYQDTNFLKKYKIIDKKFKLQTDKLLEKFMRKYFNSDDIEAYNKLVKCRSKLSKEFVYSLVSKGPTEQENKVREQLGELVVILDDFKKKNKKFNLLRFISYFDKIIMSKDPYVYVYVGNKNENYDSLSKYIRTRFDDNIIKGVSIIYKGKLYDYSLK